MTVRKILLVDDDADIRLVGSVALRRTSGWEVSEAGAGVEALTRIAEERPDVVLLDVMMPDIDGLATLARIRSDPANADLPVIFLTARAQKTEIESYLDRGADGVIPKPFDISTLANEILRIVDARGEPEVEAEEAMAPLRESYRKRLPELVAGLDASLSGALPPARECIEAARELAHRLKGTTGSYGFDAVSAELAQIESGLDVLLSSPEEDALEGWREIGAALRRAHSAARTHSSSERGRGD
jgi:CheY-like chemotaxis protein